ncbi:MAG: serine hydroxymethyltransferase, partial [Pseudobdellovibrionaceae bacterium]|nr:serine hydroxymethyltransferase [Pseudobdellovibrionaceae bacterium]
EGISGKEAEAALGEAGITVNKNTIPNDPRPPTVTSGIRLGTPALTTRGMKEAEMRQIAVWISRILRQPLNNDLKNQIKKEVSELCRKFPIYLNL